MFYVSNIKCRYRKQKICNSNIAPTPYFTPYSWHCVLKCFLLSKTSRLATMYGSQVSFNITMSTWHVSMRKLYSFFFDRTLQIPQKINAYKVFPGHGKPLPLAYSYFLTCHKFDMYELSEVWDIAFMLPHWRELDGSPKELSRSNTAQSA